MRLINAGLFQFYNLSINCNRLHLEETGEESMKTNQVGVNHTAKAPSIIEVLPRVLVSNYLSREVRYDIYLPRYASEHHKLSLLLINDGQDLPLMGAVQSLEKAFETNEVHDLVSVGIFAGDERRFEYGVLGYPDFMNRGNKTDAYLNFILHELIPALQKELGVKDFEHRYFLGFSLGGLSAFDIAISNPTQFEAVGVFSGSFWWRSRDVDADYQDDQHRIMHAKIRTLKSNSHSRFFFEAGGKDEKADRNKNGIIDSIDDTMDIIKELKKIGFNEQQQIQYLELPEGEHNQATWATVFPAFLRWLFSGKQAY